MDKLRNLYQTVIMDHYRNPYNKGLKGYPKVHLKNPACGDDITIEAKVNNGVIEKINHNGTGCSICCASASMLCSLMEGKTVDFARKEINKFYDLVQGKDGDYESLGDANSLAGVASFPARIRCATISWKALEMVLEGDLDEEREI